MQYHWDSNEPIPPVDRGYVVSMVVASFKGFENVEVHLYKPRWDESEAGSFNWESLLGEPIRPNAPVDSDGSRKVLLESFSAWERNQVLEYLQKRYSDKLESVSTSVMDFPVPLGLTPLCEVPETETIGRIHLEAVPNFELDFPVHGLYDLSRHQPIAS
jgi:hypothetical protein